MSAVVELPVFAGESEVFDFDFSLRRQFQQDTPQTITGTPTVTSSPSGLTVGSPAIGDSEEGVVDSVVQVRISGGTAGTEYTLVCTCTTSGGDTLKMVGKLVVKTPE